MAKFLRIFMDEICTGRLSYASPLNKHGPLGIQAQTVREAAKRMLYDGLPRKVSSLAVVIVGEEIRIPRHPKVDFVTSPTHGLGLGRSG